MPKNDKNAGMLTNIIRKVYVYVYIYIYRHTHISINTHIYIYMEGKKRRTRRNTFRTTYFKYHDPVIEKLHLY